MCMIDQERSYFYYPTTTVIIDDDDEFLTGLNLALKLQGDKLVKTFLNSNQALSYFKNQNNIYKNYQSFLEVVNGIEIDSDDRDKIFKINFNGIYTLPYNEKRYNEVSVIIADYFMPQMNGIDFFRKIKDIPAKKILLTGNTDYELAVAAFNDKLIDKFIIKEEGIEEEIFESINVFKKRYFQEFSKTLLRIFDNGIKEASQYTSIASAWRAKYNISEYYQCDGNGSCLGFDNRGIIYWFLICSDKEMHDYINTAENVDENSLIPDELKLGTELLFFLTDKEKLIPISKWGKYKFPIKGDFTIDNEKYFYSFVSNEVFGIDLEKISTLNKILSKTFSKNNKIQRDIKENAIYALPG